MSKYATDANLNYIINKFNTGTSVYELSGLWNGWASSFAIVSVNKKARTATVTIVLDGTNATSDIVLRYSLDNLDTCISKKGLPLPLDGIRFPIFNVTDNTYAQLGVYTSNNVDYYLSLESGKKYEIVGSYITENI